MDLKPNPKQTLDQATKQHQYQSQPQLRKTTENNPK
jgi:hypothetical protein